MFLVSAWLEHVVLMGCCLVAYDNINVFDDYGILWYYIVYIYICITPSLAEIMITMQLFQLLYFTCSVCQSSTWIGTAGCEPMGCRYGSKDSTDIAMSNWLRLRFAIQ
jgi:hypothetical protein